MHKWKIALIVAGIVIAVAVLYWFGLRGQKCPPEPEGTTPQ